MTLLWFASAILFNSVRASVDIYPEAIQTLSVSSKSELKHFEKDLLLEKRIGGRFEINSSDILTTLCFN